DHGEALGEHGELTHGLFAYEPTLKVPLVLWGPAIAPGRDGRPARHVDLLPTLLDALGVAAPEGLPGRSLLRPLPPGQTDSYFEALTANLDRGWAPLRGVLRQRRKLIELPVPELYDLARDPAELQNRFGEERRGARELAAALPAGSAWPPARGTVSGEEEARLRSLGYIVGSAEPRTQYGPADDPKNLVQVDAALQQAVLAYTAGRYEEAVAQAREVIALRPAMADGPEQLALALRQLERHDEAIAALQEAVARGVRDESLRRALALALAEVGRAGEAVTVLAPYLETPDGPEAETLAGPEPATLIALGVALSDAGRPGEAVAVLARAGRLDPEDPKVHENLGIAELRRGNAPGARGHLERALALNEALPISWNTLGVARYQLGDRAGALEAWQRATALDPRQFDALFNLGLVAAEAGRTDVARQALGRFVATAPPGRFGPDLQKARQLLAQLGG
ncbi:MAG TPA: tetratricopeptide repeat protein, partial [Thermoanaerobaculia bacterium]|nr:tetratricopeptide repeat protein [Thermoanaerobaculia bacterium]